MATEEQESGPSKSGPPSAEPPEVPKPTRIKHTDIDRATRKYKLIPQSVGGWGTIKTFLEDLFTEVEFTAIVDVRLVTAPGHLFPHM